MIRDWENPADFEWSEPRPQPSGPVFFCRDETGQLVEAGEYFRRYVESIAADPTFPVRMEQRKREKQAAVAARRAERKERRQLREQQK
jgi:hypothetical protein